MTDGKPSEIDIRNTIKTAQADLERGEPVTIAFRKRHEGMTAVIARLPYKDPKLPDDEWHLAVFKDNGATLAFALLKEFHDRGDVFFTSADTVIYDEERNLRPEWGWLDDLINAGETVAKELAVPMRGRRTITRRR